VGAGWVAKLTGRGARAAAGSCESPASSHRTHLLCDRKASSYAHGPGSQDRKLGRIERPHNVRVGVGAFARCDRSGVGQGDGEQTAAVVALGRRVARTRHCRARPAQRRGGATAAGHQRLHAGRRTGRPDAGVAAADQTPSASTRGTARPPTRRPDRKPGRLRDPPAAATGWVDGVVMLLPTAWPDCCGADAGAGRALDPLGPRGGSNYPGGLAWPAPPQPLARRERLERPRRLAAEQALRSAARGVLDPPRGAGRGGVHPLQPGRAIHPSYSMINSCAPTSLGRRRPPPRPTQPRLCCGQVVTRSQARCALCHGLKPPLGSALSPGACLIQLGSVLAGCRWFDSATHHAWDVLAVTAMIAPEGCATKCDLTRYNALLRLLRSLMSHENAGSHSAQRVIGDKDEVSEILTARRRSGAFCIRSVVSSVSATGPCEPAQGRTVGPLTSQPTWYDVASGEAP
jgi:hypothetical protein